MEPNGLVNMRTVIIWRKDSRYTTGERQVLYRDCETLAEVRQLKALYSECRIEEYVTYQEVRNIMTGQMVWERFDTPFHCSVRSEAYFSN